MIAYLGALIVELEEVKKGFTDRNVKAMEAIDQREAATVSRVQAKIGKINYKKGDA